MPTFCRHNRFLERCPICSKTLPGNSPSTTSRPRAKSTATRTSATGADGRRRRVRSESVRVRREGRAEDDGYRSPLVPGLRASADAIRLVEEIAFSAGRLDRLANRPPGLYGEVQALAGEDVERATWISVLIAYLCPLDDEDPFAGIRMALDRATPADVSSSDSSPTTDASHEWELPSLEGIPLGPRTSHDPRRGADTLTAYWQWVHRAGGGEQAVSGAAEQAASGTGSQEVAFTGDPGWTPQRRFERIYERLALPGFARMGRYDLLLTLGALGVYELVPGSLLLAGVRGLSADDQTTLAAKRLFGIGDPLLLERRAAALAEAASVPIGALDLALANWAASQRASLGLPSDTNDDGAFERAGDALGL
jgi:hypothetical protein